MEFDRPNNCKRFRLVTVLKKCDFVDLCRRLRVFHCICFWKENCQFVKQKWSSFLFQKNVLNNWRNVCKTLNLMKKNLTKICEHFVYIKILKILIIFNQSIINSFVIFVSVMQFNTFYFIDFYKKFNEFRESWSWFFLTCDIMYCHIFKKSVLCSHYFKRIGAHFLKQDQCGDC